jgi:cellulose synthase/poly-beta-1,6-N-acetylglucosamine synthase-like glycosyltransferase
MTDHSRRAASPCCTRRSIGYYRPLRIVTGLVVWVTVFSLLFSGALLSSLPLVGSAAAAAAGDTNPFAGTSWFIDPLSPARAQAREWRVTRPNDAALMDRIAAQPTADWFDGTSGDVRQGVADRLRTIEAAGAIPVLVAYNIPLRDCTGGGAASAADYRAWIRQMASGIGGKRAVVILEPDAIAHMDCISTSAQKTRLDLITDAVDVLAALPAVSVYIDAGHANWVAADKMAALLDKVGIAKVQGFSLNVAGFGTTEDNIAYGHALSRAVGGKHFVIDTGRNGLGPDPDSAWCNPPGRALGLPPTSVTGDSLVDAYLWVKRPGDSDGTCNGGPVAGTWWPEYALGLVQRAAMIQPGGDAARADAAATTSDPSAPEPDRARPTITDRVAGAMDHLLGRMTIAVMLLISVALSSRGFFTLGLMLFTWSRTDRMLSAGSPATFEPPTIRFTALLPARHEREVIANTVKRVWAANYPSDMLEVAVVCEHQDIETIGEARRAAAEIGHPNARVITFDDGPINKPHGLNVALRGTTHEVVTIFDAEDDVHPDIFNVANTIMLRNGAGILQAGVQLMDFQSTWFSLHNVLEYFFWFKSRLHFHAQVGMVPLGGNTVFMRRELIDRVGGWDEECLTEDADIGIRLSTLGERITISYDAEHATREETPPTLMHFIKQRTRWNQGFLQVLRKGLWKQFPHRTQRMLAAYTLTYPFVQSVLGVLWVPALVTTFTLKLPVGVAMVSLMPLYALAFQFMFCLLGLFSFARAYQLRVRPRDIAVFTISFLPYQILLSLGALRAVYRDQRGRTNWEKTAHTGAHRTVSVPQLTSASD